ncbi:hypothetical protein G9A89_006227 [Geosiphon pyriformis]|nr:hypothetical protein G9A89_006227 [Geosiphon pyriformis]
MRKAASLAKQKEIIINNDVKKQRLCSDWAVVIKEIPMDMPKEMIVAALSEFGQVVSIRLQLIGLWQKAVVEFAKSNSVCMAKAVRNCETCTSRDQFRVLLFTLSVGTTVHNLGNLLEETSEKTCVINRSLESGNRTRCAVVGLESNKMLKSAFCMVLIFGRVKLSWAKLGFVQYNKCGKFSHSVLECDAEIASTSKLPKSFIKQVTLDENCLQLAKLYVKKSIIFSASTSSGLSVGSDSSFFSSGGPGSGGLPSSTFSLNSALNDCLFGMYTKTPKWCQVGVFGAFPSVVANSNSLSNMVLDSLDSLSNTPLLIATDGLVLGLSSSKVLTSKLNSLESKFVALEVLIMSKFDGIWVFTFGLDSGHLGSEVAIIMNNFLAQHICKILDISGQLFSLRLLFKNNLSVSVLELYARASLAVCFSQADNVNSLIARVVNESSFIILGGNFNEDDSHKSASFKKCFDLDLVNSLSEDLYKKKATWNNSRGVVKTIDYVFVSSNLVNVILDCGMAGVEKFFNTDHKAVFVSVSLGGLLDVQLNSLCKQYNFKGADDALWSKFKDETAVNAAMLYDDFLNAKMCSDLDAMWNAVHKTLSAINRRMESFESNKGHTIRSVLEWLFCKVVLDYLVVGKELILEPDHVKDKVDEIIEGVIRDVPEDWSCQYQPMEHVFNGVFSNVMNCISFVELFGVISNLPDEKAASLSNISNELWKHCNGLVLNMLLVLINFCLSDESIPGVWKEA